MPDKIYKPNQVHDDQTRMTITRLGPEEKFAGKVLLSLKEKISEARGIIKKLEQEIEEKKEQAEQESKGIIANAESEAEDIKEEARQEAEKIIGTREEEIEKARNEGYDDGYSEGWEKSREETAELIAQGEKILDEARRERQAYISDHENELIKLAGRLATKIIRDQVEIDEQLAVRTVSKALEQVSDVKEITLVLNPDDYKAIEEVIETQKEKHPSIQEISIVEEPHMEKGSCRIRTDYGDIDATLSGQLEYLTEQLINAS
ncbi:MAG: FliH/SctL family protein [bacterium]